MKSLNPALLVLAALSLPACGEPHHHPHPHQEVPVSVEEIKSLSDSAFEVGSSEPAHPKRSTVATGIMNRCFIKLVLIRSVQPWILFLNNVAEIGEAMFIGITTNFVDCLVILTLQFNAECQRSQGGWT